MQIEKRWSCIPLTKELQKHAKIIALKVKGGHAHAEAVVLVVDFDAEDC